MPTSSILAMKAGKHVYCEKPLTHNIREARLVARVAKETGVATQMGNQGRSSEGHRQTVEWLKDGAIGAVREVHAWSGSPRTAKRAQARRGPGEQAGRPQLGPLARPARRAALQRQATRRSSGAGLVGLRQRHACPTWRRTTSIPRSTRLASTRRSPSRRRRRTWIRRRAWAANLVTYQLRRDGATADRCTVFWYDNGLRPPDAARHRSRRPATAARRRRQRPPGRRREGRPHVRRVVRHAAPAADGAAPRVQAPAEDAPARGRPSRRLAAGLQGRHTGVQQFRVRRALTEFVLLGTLALRTGKVMKWDAEGMKATNVPEAQPFIEGSYRKGWELPV